MKIQEINVYAVLIHQKKVLVLKRKDNGFWEFPGGGVEFGEHPDRAVIREVEEETGIKIANPILIGVTSAVYEKNGMEKHSIYLVYKASVSNEHFELRAEHSEGKWLTPFEIKFINLALNAKDIAEQLDFILQ